MKKTSLFCAAVVICGFAAISLNLSSKESTRSLVLSQIEALASNETGGFSSFTPDPVKKSCPVYGLVWEGGRYVSKIVGYATKDGRACLPGGSSPCTPYAPC